VKIDLTDGIRRLEPLFDLSATNLLLYVKGQEIGRDVLSISMPSTSPILRPAAPQRMKITRSRRFFHRAKPVITSVEKEGVFCSVLEPSVKDLTPRCGRVSRVCAPALYPLPDK